MPYNWNKKQNSCGPVSYTHLDVYKRQMSRKHTNSATCTTYMTKDGRWIQLAAIQYDKTIDRLAKALEVEFILEDERFNAHKNMIQHIEELVAILEPAFAKKTLAEWNEILTAADIPFEIVQTMEEIAVDPQAWANDYIFKTVSYTHLTRAIRTGRAEIVISDCIVLSTLRPSTLCSNISMPTGIIRKSTHQKVLYNGFGSSSGFKPIDVYILRAVPFPVAVVARLKNIRTINTIIANLEKGIVSSTIRVTPLLPISLITPERLRPWKSSCPMP